MIETKKKNVTDALPDIEKRKMKPIEKNQKQRKTNRKGKKKKEETNREEKDETH